MSGHVSVGGIAKDLQGAYVGIGGVAKEVQSIYVGVGGVAKLAWENGYNYDSLASMTKLCSNSADFRAAVATDILFNEAANHSAFRQAMYNCHSTTRPILKQLFDSGTILNNSPYDYHEWTSGKTMAVTLPGKTLIVQVFMSYDESDSYTYSAEVSASGSATGTTHKYTATLNYQKPSIYANTMDFFSEGVVTGFVKRSGSNRAGYGRIHYITI